jgi:hypothetical protein
VLNRLLILLAPLSISQGATGKCTSLFNFFENVVSECLGSSPAISNGVQPEAHLPPVNSILNADARKRRVDDHSSVAP